MLIYWFPYILTTPFLREEENMGPRASDFSTTSSIKTVNTTPHSFSLQNIAPFVTPINSPTQAIGHYIRFLHPSALVPYPETQRFPCSQTSDAKSSALVKRLAWSKELSVLKAKSSALKQRVKRLLAWSKEVGATWSKEVSVKQSGWRYMKQRGWREAKRLALHEAKRLALKQRAGWREAKSSALKQRLAWSKEVGVKQRGWRYMKQRGWREAKTSAWSKDLGAEAKRLASVKQRGGREAKRSARSKQVAWREWGKELIREWENSGFLKPILEYSWFIFKVLNLRRYKVEFMTSELNVE